MGVNWERRHEAFKAIHDKIAEVLARLHDVILKEEGTWLPFRLSPTSPPEEKNIKTPTVGKKLQILSFFYYSDADIITEMRFETSDKLVAGLPTKGVAGMNELHRAPAEGGLNEALMMYFSGVGNAVGWIVYKEV